MVEVRVVRTGSIRVRPSNQAGNMHHPVWRRRLAILLDQDWTQPLPIYTYLIKHDEGLILLDSGGSALSAKPGVVPWRSPLWLAVDIHLEPGDEIGPGCGRWALTRARTCGCSYYRTRIMTMPTVSSSRRPVLPARWASS